MLSVLSAIGFLLLSHLGVQTAFAIDLPNAPCTGNMIGCNSSAPVNIVLTAITGSRGIAVTLLELSAGLAVLFMVWAGIQMIISMGDESKITQQKWAMAYALIGFSVSILSQFVISTVGTQDFGQTGSSNNLLISIISKGTLILRTVLNALFLMMIAVAALRMLYAQGKADDYNTGKKMLYWGVAGAVLVNLAAALVYAVAAFFGLA